MNSTRKLVSVIVLLLLAAVATAKLPTMASPISESTAGGNAQDTTAVVTVEPERQARFAAGEKPGYLIYFRNQADLSAAYRMDWEERGQYVVETLQAAAKESQANVRKYLDEQGVDYQSFWIENVIVVDSSTKATFQALLSFNEVESIRARRTMQVIDPEQESVSAPEAATAVEPNIAHVLAPDAWAAGYRGEGMVVANVDTGVRGTHQALVRQYRGTTTGSNDYNWLGAAGGSPTPVDDHGHGTHTMGTIVGEDATLTNQIGIAPGAQWIACDACEGTGCPDAALLTCAQWIAAPYPVGNPAAPDPNMRPNVVNNSWGDCGQTYDNWFESSISAWQAAGIYPVFSNGNASNCGYSAPPGLNTVGNPARSGNVTGVGSSGESNGLYATHSNWGPTDNLDTVNPHPGWADLKPQVIAPGVSIRSSTPGSDTEYQDGWSGTSMSAPHVTGLVALMMQAGSCLVGDYAAVETIIEETATPIYYDDMGTGARWPNYASGWGEINVAAAVEAASQACGPSGTLTGTVTDSSTTNPVQGADVTLTQSPTMTYQLTTDAAGLYERVVPTGVYTVEVAAFGYLPASINNANVYSGTTTTVDVALDPAPTYTVSGVVADANTGWPLYASVDIAGYPGGTIWTDPVTGYYSVVLPAGASYDFTVESFIDGYLAETRTVGPITGDVTENFALGVDELACNAPGYSISGGLVETFDSVTAPALPAGWAVVDVTGTTGDWKTNAGTRYPSGNAAHSAPNVAYFNAFSVSSGSTRLYRQSGVDMTSLSSSSLSFWMFRDDGYSGANDTLQVQVSLDNGASWINVGSPFSRYSSTGDYWEEKTVDLSAYSTETNLRLGFLAVSAYGNDIHIDDMILGGVPSCNAPAGALVVGSVYDKNT
ncbi:MAG: S8 family serine peptidase, partial [Anaerolineales bacterium]|nr:S8 family serine peptidase [Anaerolineales bacterium]